jgi:aminoglycoside phosphotransferase (APT) family kinase protein
MAATTPPWKPQVVADAALAARLIARQFPAVEPSSFELLGEGYDMTVWKVNGMYAFRFPRREVVVPFLEREMTVLPLLAPLLPLAVPDPVFQGRPDEEFPWPFMGSPLLPGREVGDLDMDQASLDHLAAPLALFLRALHSPAARAAVDGIELPVDWMGRGDVQRLAVRLNDSLTKLRDAGLWSVPASVERWLAAAAGLPLDPDRVLVHGDLHLRHLLVESGAITGVIDWIDVGIASPAVDLVLYWSLLSDYGRASFRQEYGSLRPDQLQRARVLALWLCSMLALYAHDEGQVSLLAAAIAGLERTAAD